MKLNLSTKNLSKISITPQLQNAIKLLQFTAVEINQEIQNIFETNPLIEKEDICEEFQNDNCTEHYLHYEKDFSFNNNINSISTSDVIERTSSEEDTLQKYLQWQVSLSNLSDNDKYLADSIIDYVNSDGYLVKDIFEIFDDVYLNTEISLDEFIAVQHFLQNLDPVGTCAKNIQESLLVQVENSTENIDLKNKALILLNEFFTEYTDNKTKTILKNLNLKIEDFELIDNLIKKQSPRPGNIIQNKKHYDYIIPDIQIIKDESNWIIKNNKVISPEIKINKNYIDISEKNLSSEDKIYVKEKLQEAKLFIKNINYRNNTLLLLSKRIFQKQKKFFDHGIEGLVPMNLKNVAAVSGKSGLFKVVKPTRTGVILEAMDASKKKWVANASHRVSILREISIYVTGEESSVLLEDVYSKIKKKYNTELPVTSKSTTKELFSFLGEILPDYDEERVYSSDVKKMVSWYSLITEFAPEVMEEASSEEEGEETKMEA